MKDAGFLLGKTGPGRNVLTLMPPLVVTSDALDRCCSRPSTVHSDCDHGLATGSRSEP